MLMAISDAVSYNFSLGQRKYPNEEARIPWLVYCGRFTHNKIVSYLVLPSLTTDPTVDPPIVSQNLTP
jgi:hypothetical protein